MTRYKRFEQIKFGENVSIADQHKYIKELLPYEHAFAESQDSIGNVSRFPFKLHPTSTRPIRAKAITYPPAARKWLKQECQTLCDRGVIKRILPGDVEPDFIANIVLVPAG